MRRSIVTCAGLGATVTGMMLLAAAPALAHGEAGEGDLVLTIGFADEPAYAGLPNAAQLHVEHGGEPVNDLKPGDVEVEITFGDETSEPMDMQPWFFFEGGDLVFGEPGEYRADFVPSQPGTYTFHFTGTIDDEEIDEEMTSGPDTFSVVEDATAASFPAVTSSALASASARVMGRSGSKRCITASTRMRPRLTTRMISCCQRWSITSVAIFALSPGV